MTIAPQPIKRSRRGAKMREGSTEFDDKQEPARKFLEPQRKLVCVPTDPRRKRLGFVMDGQGSQVVPGFVARCELDHAARGEH